MAGNKTITISTDALRDSACDLRRLHSEWNWKSSSAVSIGSFRESSGMSADRLDEYAELTHHVAKSLQDLFENSRRYFVDVSDSFGNADVAAAEMIKE